MIRMGMQGSDVTIQRCKIILRITKVTSVEINAGASKFSAIAGIFVIAATSSNSWPRVSSLPIAAASPFNSKWGRHPPTEQPETLP